MSELVGSALEQLKNFLGLIEMSLIGLGRALKTLIPVKKSTLLIHSQGYLRKMQIIFLSGVKVMTNTI